MFKSIRWKFITVYFLLVFIAMIIVGIFIVKAFEDQQIKQTSESMESYVEKLLEYSSVVKNEDWNREGTKKSIKDTIKKWPLPTTDRIYIINNSPTNPVIIAANPNNENIVDTSAYENKEIEPQLFLGALNEGVNKQGLSVNNDNIRVKHLAYPVTSDEMGEVKGIIYMASDLKNITDTLDESKIILAKATLLALLITVTLGFFIARSITEPINDVTVKAEKMAKGDFNQYVDVKSNDEIGQLASMFNFLTDKLNSTISEMYREKSKMETLFNYMADGLLAVNDKGDIIHANPVALNILNFTYNDIIKIKFDDIFKDIDKNITLEYLTKKDSWEGAETIHIGKSTYRAKYAPFKNNRNEIGGLIIVFQDITEQHKLENMRKEFVANVSHELKTPITTIKSYSETLLDGAIDNKGLATQFLTVVNDECDRMARIVRDLLQLSNFDFKEMKWDKSKLSINKLIESSYMKINMAAQEKKQSINIDIKEDLPKIYGDKDALEQVMLNILSNAVKYTPDEGQINVCAETKGEKILVTIEDNGIGIPKEDLNRIFERFYRVDKARSRALGGTGLGLSIAKQIVIAHGGDITIESEYNVGTKVNLILPKENN
ncbi:MAG: cell wall metabolism sensor histidine kinase WalK [Firmicutes bacterium]|nr:cell wall metabolism sensor histidine kinase WalK [Bacillota bacterium]